LEFANLVNATVDDFTNALGQTIPAFKEGRTKDGAAGLLQMVSSLTPMMGALGPAGGALGGLISVALGIVSSILSAFEDQRKTLATEIKDELRHLHAQLIHDELVAAMGDLERAYRPMQEVKDQTRTWEQMQSGWINMFEGNAAHQLNLTRSWLEKTENQSNDEWPLIFDCFWHVVDLRLLVFAVMVTKLMDGEAQKIGAMALKERRERDLAFAQQIYPVVLNRGKLWHIGNDRDIWERNYIVTDSVTDDYTNLNKKADVSMVGPITKNFYALDKASGKIWTTPRNWRVVHEVKGGAIDLWAMPEPNDKGPAGERLVALAKNGNVLESLVLPSNDVVKTQIQGNTNKISQFRSIQIVGGVLFNPKIGPSVHYICLGQDGKIYCGQSSSNNRLSDKLQLTQWLDLAERILGLSIGKDKQLRANQILAYTDKTVLLRRVKPGDPFPYPRDDPNAWKPMEELPPGASGKITFAAASQNGHVLVCVSNKLWVFMPLTQKASGDWNWGWKEEKKGSMKAVFEEPIQGFDKYSEFWKSPST
jgi:hypothetical protein